MAAKTWLSQKVSLFNFTVFLLYLGLEKWKDFVESRSVSEMKVLPGASLLHFNSHG